MYLFHVATINALKSILKDGYLKSYSLLKKSNKTPKDSYGYTLYTENNFVFFSCCDKLFDNKIIGHVILYFNSKLLYNRCFYVSTVWSPYPDYLDEWYSGGKDNKKKEYKRKYNRYFLKYDNVLKKLYNHSTSEIKYFQFKQVAVRNKVNLKELVAIEFSESFKNDKILNYISKNYPNIKIVFKK